MTNTEFPHAKKRRMILPVLIALLFTAAGGAHAQTPGGTNVALASNGSTATASSTTLESEGGGTYPPSGAINGDRRGAGWAIDGGWRDGTNNAYPDWLRVTFPGSRTISEIDVFTLQDNYQNPSEPTETMTFSLYGITSFEVQYLSGSSWVTVPGGSVTGNNRVWRKFTFPAVTTTSVRVLVNAALGNRSRIVEVEAWTAPAPEQGFETVWVEDDTPSRATLASDQDTWSWVSSGPAPYSGTRAHRSAPAAEMHQHYFFGAQGALAVYPGDRLIVYVYLDPVQTPDEVMLQWHDNASWEHRAYWGSNQIGWGVDGTESRRYMGPLPAAGQWVRLEVPASLVGLEGRSITGMAFTLFNGGATWDRAGKWTPGPTPVAMQILAPSTTDLNYRLAGMAGFSVAFTPDQYRLYATTNVQRGKWRDNNNLYDYYLESLAGRLNSDPENCSLANSVSNWNARCIDGIGLVHKRVICNTSVPNYACQDNDLWNAYPGRSNMRTFPSRPPLDDSGVGFWPLNQNWGVKNLSYIISPRTVNSAQPSPPLAGAAGRCYPLNGAGLATGTANSKVVQVKYTDPATQQQRTRWFMAYNSQIHSEENGGWNSADTWRVQWAYSDDGLTWTLENRTLFRSPVENVSCLQGYLVTDLIYDEGYFYMVFNSVLSDHVFLVRSPFVAGSAVGYDASQGWFVWAGPNQWVQIHPWQLGQQVDMAALGGRSILPTRFSAYAGAVKQTTIGRVFASSQPGSDSRYVAITVDQPAPPPGQPALSPVVQLWTASSLSAGFTYQSDVINVPFGGYGYEFAFTHYADNESSTPRLYDNNFEIWFTQDYQCALTPAPCPVPNASPPYMGLASLTASRRRARLSGGIYGP